MTSPGESIDLSSSSCSARVHAHGAHLVDWTPTGAEGVLWLSPLSRFESTAAIRGGVPVILPWFGPGPTGAMKPSHGFGRLSEWRLESLERRSDTVTATFALDSTMATCPEFPFAYSAQYVIRAGAQLELTLTVTNTGDVDFTFEEALHTYLAVGDVERVRVEGLDGAEYLDKVAGYVTPPSVQDGDITLGSEVDRVYRSASRVRVIDPVLHRVLVVTKTHAASTIVWNPGAIKAAEPAAADIGVDNWRAFVCVEGGNIMGDAITLKPSDSTVMGYAIAVESLAAEG